MWYGITMIVGVILLGIAGKLFMDRMALLRNGEKTTATVIALEQSRSTRRRDGKSRERVTYKPVFKFFTATNEEIIYRGYFSSSYPGFQVGDKARLVYPADNPENAKVLTFGGVFVLPVMLLALSAVCLIVSGGYYLAQRILEKI